MHRPFLLLLLLLIQVTAMAQLGNTLRRMLNGDSLAPPDHDTTYIRTYRDQLTLSLVTTYNMVNLGLVTDDGRSCDFSSNSTEQYGAGLNYKWLSAEATFNIPALDAADKRLGTTRARSFGLGYTGRRLWARGFWNSTQGFYLSEPERWITGLDHDAEYVRGDLTSDTYMVSLNYALSGKRRYSQNGALFQMERQKKSAGTFVAGFSGWITAVHSDSSMVSTALQDTFGLATGFDEVRRTVFGATIGYTHTFAFWHKGFLHLSALPGLAYLHQRINATSGPHPEGGGIGSVTEFRAGAGFNGDRWYAALTMAYYYCTSDIGEQLALGTLYGFVRFGVGVRLRGPQVRGLDKLGL